MLNPLQLKELADMKIGEAKSIYETAKAEDRPPTDDERAKADALKAEAVAFTEKAQVILDDQKAAADLDNVTASIDIPTRQVVAPPESVSHDVEVGDPPAVRDPKGGFKTFNEFALKVKEAFSPNSPKLDSRLAEINAAAQGGATYGGADGGFLIPTDFSNRLMARESNPDLPILSMMDQMTVVGNSIEINALIDNDRSSAATRHGGIIAYWVKEAGEITKSQLETRQIKLELNKVAALSYATDEELADVANYGSRLFATMSEALTEEILEKVLFGTGAGQPLGILSATNPCLVSQAKETNQVADTVVFENIVKMWSRGWRPGRSIWVYNNEVFPQLALMEISVGTGGSAVFLPAGGASAAPFSTLMGRPAFMTDHCSALGDVGDIALIDPSQFILATKGTEENAMSIHLRFQYAETAFRMMFRMDARPWWDAVVTPRKGASTATLSPAVYLAERA
jgi:HK97 family phage major capsid protein